MLLGDERNLVRLDDLERDAHVADARLGDGVALVERVRARLAIGHVNYAAGDLDALDRAREIRRKHVRPLLADARNLLLRQAERAERHAFRFELAGLELHDARIVVARLLERPGIDYRIAPHLLVCVRGGALDAAADFLLLRRVGVLLPLVHLDFADEADGLGLADAEFGVGKGGLGIGEAGHVDELAVVVRVDLRRGLDGDAVLLAFLEGLASLDGLAFVPPQEREARYEEDEAADYSLDCGTEPGTPADRLCFGNSHCFAPFLCVCG